MSAYIVEDRVINRIVSTMADGRDKHPASYLKWQMELDIECSEEDRAKLGQMLFQLNIDSVEQRYGSAEGFRPLDYKYSYELPVNSMSLLKALTEWSYQSCEGDVPETELYKVMEHIEHSVAVHICMNLPEWAAVVA